MKLLPNRTKIVATLGPASNGEASIVQLAKSGVNVFRLNCSHADHETLKMSVERIRAASKKTGLPLGILADLQGPKIRVGQLKDAEPILLTPGQKIIISTKVGTIGAASDNPKKPAVIGTSYVSLAKDVKAGEPILLDDGNLELRVKSVKGEEVTCEVVYGGLLKQYKGINLPGSKVSAPCLTKKDLADLKVVLALNVDFVALSFVRTGADIVELRKLIDKAKSNAKIVAKVERPEAIDHIDDIIKETFAVMVARGDMGVEVGAELVPSLQKTIIRKSLAASKPVITATQMLESMISNPRPTRAEASDVANAVHDGTSAVMLSAETASGDFPIEAVETMGRIARRTEEFLFQEWTYEPHWANQKEPTSVPLATVRAAAYGALEVGAKAICVFTESGATARHIAGERIPIPVVAFTPHDETVQRLALSWGIIPRKVGELDSSYERTLEGEKILLAEKLAKKGDRVVMVFGSTKDAGITNIMHVRTLGSGSNSGGAST